MLTDCKHCKAAVDAKVIADYESFDDELQVPVKFTLAMCPRCASPLLLVQEQYGEAWDKPARLYPPREDIVSWSIPKPIRNAFREAVRCLNARSYTATAIMCRKALEGVCHNHAAAGKNLQAKLKALKEAGVIEGRLFQWADELRLVGNAAAHDVNVEVNAQDASDTVEFTRAVLEYVYTFRERFEQFKKRRAKAAEAKPTARRPKTKLPARAN